MFSGAAGNVKTRRIGESIRARQEQVVAEITRHNQPVVVA
jgi:hypothetical protein